jgi:hypothetical protein
MSTRETPGLHERVRFTRSVQGIPVGAIGWVVNVYERAGGVGIDLEDPDLHPEPVVDLAPDELDALEDIPADV